VAASESNLGSGPAVRASYLRLLLSACDEFGPPALEIRERVGDTHLTSIECAGPLVWLPLEAELALQRALDEVLGAARTREFVLARARQFMAGSMLQNLMQAAVGLFGLDPGSLARLVPSGWSLLYRNCGRWSVTRSLDPDRLRAREWREVELRLLDVPEVCLDQDAWITAVGTVQHALLLACGRRDDEGEVELLERVLGQPPQLVFRLAWKSK
jgi:hypothetical protein